MSAQSAIAPASDAALSDLFVSDTPLLDVRAPVEFQRGAFPTAVNLPLLNDTERSEIGIRYKHAGQDAAIALGHELVSGETRAQRVAAWQEFIRHNPEAKLYCFRGGQRSKIVQQWLGEAGDNIVRIEGGYKAMRRFLIDTLDRLSRKQQFIIIAGKTGVGKTEILQQLSAALDLEGRANHRGSAFGRRVGGQPTQINFENHIAIDLLKLDTRKAPHIFVEDESRAVGSLSVPQLLFAAMRSAPLAVIEQSLSERSNVILNDYILANYADFEQRYPDDHFQHFAAYLRDALARIRRRLGDKHFPVIDQAMESALHAHEQQGEVLGHREWITQLLSHYYDPMYDYQLAKKSHRLVFRGNREEFMDWSRHLTSPEVLKP